MRELTNRWNVQKLTKIRRWSKGTGIFANYENRRKTSALGTSRRVTDPIAAIREQVRKAHPRTHLLLPAGLASVPPDMLDRLGRQLIASAKAAQPGIERFVTVQMPRLRRTCACGRAAMAPRRRGPIPRTCAVCAHRSRARQAA